MSILCTDLVKQFFAYARERHYIYLRRVAGDPPPWTEDPILQRYKFTNVYREVDRVTRWCRQHVRERYHTQPAHLLMGLVIFRWFNRIETGEAIFSQRNLWLGADYSSNETAFDRYMSTWDTSCLRESILKFVGKKGPWVTGAYTINTRSAGLGLNKLDGVLRLIDIFARKDVEEQAHLMVSRRGRYTLQEFCRWAQVDAPCMGPFMAYEVACDLRWTPLLDRAPDILTWANPGPGAQRGIRRLMGDEDKHAVGRAMSEDEALEAMRLLLKFSERLWRPRTGRVEDWPAWEMREVEHTLCEYDKYQRVLLGQGHPRGSYSGGA